MLLQIIRDKFSGVIALVIIGAIAITLVISFSGMDGGVASGNFAAEVNGEPIPMANYQRVAQNQLYRQQEALQGELTSAIQEQIQRSVLEGMVRNEVIKQFVRDSGFRVSDERVMQEIRRQPVFQVGGEYSYASYVVVLGQQGIVPEQYEFDQRAQMEIGQLENAIVVSDFFTPAEYRRYIELLAEERTAAHVLLDPRALSADIDLPESRLREYYDANSERFMSAESVRLEYVEVSLADISSGVTVAEDEVRAYYDSAPERFIDSDQRRISHILIQIDEESGDSAAVAIADDLGARLDQDESFEALAREYSADPVSAAEGGNLGWARPGDYPEAFEAALFDLEIGQVSAPVRTEFGIHLIRLDELRAGAQQAFADVRDQLYEELVKQRATDGYYALADQMDDLALENSGNLASVAEQAGLELKIVETFTRTGGEPLGFNPALVDATFSVAVLEDGENSALIELADERAVIVSVAEHRTPALKPFEEVREAVTETLRLQSGVDLAAERGAELLARLEAGGTFDGVAAEFAITPPESAVLTRTARDVSPEVLAEIFRAPRPEEGASAYHGARLASGAYAVFRLDAVTPGRPDAIPQQQRDERKQLLAQQAGGNAAAALVADLRSKARVQLAPGLFDQATEF